LLPPGTCLLTFLLLERQCCQAPHAVMRPHTKESRTPTPPGPSRPHGLTRPLLHKPPFNNGYPPTFNLCVAGNAAATHVKCWNRLSVSEVFPAVASCAPPLCVLYYFLFPPSATVIFLFFFVSLHQLLFFYLLSPATGV
jgi:hypothetical protein